MASAAAALAAADRLMHAAKRSGKNAFVVEEFVPHVGKPDTPVELEA